MEITKEEIAQKLWFHQDSSLVFINCFLGVPHTFSLLVLLPHRSMSGLANQTKSRSQEDVPKVNKKKKKTLDIIVTVISPTIPPCGISFSPLAPHPIVNA